MAKSKSIFTYVIAEKKNRAARSFQGPMTLPPTTIIKSLNQLWRSSSTSTSLVLLRSNECLRTNPSEWLYESTSKQLHRTSREILARRHKGECIGRSFLDDATVRKPWKEERAYNNITGEDDDGSSPHLSLLHSSLTFSARKVNSACVALPTFPTTIKYSIMVKSLQQTVFRRFDLIRRTSYSIYVQSPELRRLTPLPVPVFRP
ncbi:uncharacterized protein ARMOST_16128 [Armillaria ostoyae]|uniref:Uncharacterized protein n=1 Tax=Armillaria ostoyae TaxID=47428 RepID=A0A284RVD1_ARMOS|nr:uncharacterized protein ARMOST_16128 [Armillaria ostoyae]